MPWKATDAMKERVKFVLEWEKRWNDGEGRLNFSELCREFGVSREVGYVWVRRFREADRDLRAVEERSRRPHTSPTQVSEEVEDVIVAARKLHPTWGPRKLRSWLGARAPWCPLAAPSTIGEVLRRRGMTTSVRRRQRATQAATQPFADVTGPNATWCVDFKGQFRTGDARQCYPLTILDAHSRYLIRCEGVADPNGREVQRIFDSAFSEFGLPSTIRSDNGPPFASVGAGGLTKLSIWWLRLGIRVERIAPGKPQQNGRQERFHRTLKAETTKPARANLRAQQRAFDVFRRIYNEERPHEALGQTPPALAYELSPRRYPTPLLRFDADPWQQVLRVDKSGCIRWDGRRVPISAALAYEDIGLAYDGATEEWNVVFGPVALGALRDTRGGVRFVARRARATEPPRDTCRSFHAEPEGCGQ
jgi:transposase InsO family protein